jgi:MarR family transcriptional regulator, organic hydroperoxide resistance regulator
MNSLEQYLSHLLDLAHRRVGADLENVLSTKGVTTDEWRVLEVLRDEQGRGMGDLAQLVAMNHPTLTKLIDKMVAKSWVQRNIDERDSRRVLVYVTNIGLKLIARLEEPLAEHRRTLTQALGDRQAKQLRNMLAALIEK